MGPVGSAPPLILTQSSFVIERGLGENRCALGQEKKKILDYDLQRKRSATHKRTRKNTKESELCYLISAGESITNF
jgi:hypothetical protein